MMKKRKRRSALSFFSPENGCTPVVLVQSKYRTLSLTLWLWDTQSTFCFVGAFCNGQKGIKFWQLAQRKEKCWGNTEDILQFWSPIYNQWCQFWNLPFGTLIQEWIPNPKNPCFWFCFVLFACHSANGTYQLTNLDISVTAHFRYCRSFSVAIHLVLSVFISHQVCCDIPIPKGKLTCNIF